MSEAATHSGADRRELISFRIGKQEFCVNVMSVREIRGWTATTPLPQSPAFVHGVINLRGAVLPVIDLGRRLGISSTSRRRATSSSSHGSPTNSSDCWSMRSATSSP